MKLLPILFSGCLLLVANRMMGQEKEPAPIVEEIFQVVEQRPLFPGCENEPNKQKRIECAQEKMMEFVYSHLEYPEAAKANGIEGTVVIRFVVDKDGSITRPEIIRDIGHGCGDAALEVIKQMPQWNPGKQRGEPVKVFFNIPVKFPPKANKVSPQSSFPPPPPPPSQSEEIFRVVEQMPTFPGCENETDKNKRRECAQIKMLKFIYSHVKYPAEARAKRLEGTVVIRFVVEKDGRISNPEVIQDIGGGCGDAALKIVEQMPVWHPGKQRNQPKRVYFNLHIKFKLG